VLNISKDVVAHCSTEHSICLPAGMHSKRNTQCSMFNFQCWTRCAPVTRHPSTVNCQLSAVNCQLSTVSCQL